MDSSGELEGWEWSDPSWDPATLGLTTRELTLPGAPFVPDAASLKEFDALCRRDGIDLAVARVDADRQAAAGRLQGSGWHYVETAMDFALRRLAKWTPDRSVDRPLALQEATAGDQAKLEAICDTVFNHGRFFEDPRIERDRARARQRGWVRGAIEAAMPVVVHKDASGDILCFMVYESTGPDEVSLQLGGSAQGYGFLTAIFIANLLKDLKEQGVKRVTARVSAANIGIINCYTTLDFSLTRTLVGFHKHYLAER
ncbi:hypothetical protein E5163_04010 [Marinicauda algicola]|uniref:GNAT family N-acetyltransferase n=1 Tax=Marinicauda algicola TaxID=2029849 RepID=A0A4S2H4G0_9PROT|nr:hypothetical protein [Marinicauda algicola]TGY90298.1 hypothetical protein E5163_04010 [Marinicauda algicola]